MTKQPTARESAKQKRNNAILYHAEKLFLRKGIDNTTMNDIADHAGIGIATLFRYFPKKDQIILAIATEKIHIMLDEFYRIEQEPLSCYGKIEAVLDFFIHKMMEPEAALPKILDNFINYAAVSEEEMKEMDMYTKARKEINRVCIRMIEEGKSDGTLRSDLDPVAILPTMLSNFSVFTLKLSLIGSTNLIEPALSPLNQLQIMKDIFLNYIKP
ncbi:TetR/AcrR family transcriptional regulator [Bacillus testis]|uniref:TetR/AcrR family transcriptional regulator n=1 Tax=Bacillus testis TaxID=1622072 RepID=UPI00067EF7E8|nr:TetR/AcrR family transcriptional regulator [Bacillus testis]